MAKFIDVKFRPKKDTKSGQQEGVTARVFVSEANLLGLGPAFGEGKPCLIEGPKGVRREATLWIDKQLTGTPGPETSPAKASTAFLEACGFSLSEVYRITPLAGPIPEAEEVSLMDISKNGTHGYPEKWITILEIRLAGKLVCRLGNSKRFSQLIPYRAPRSDLPGHCRQGRLEIPRSA